MPSIRQKLCFDLSSVVELAMLGLFARISEPLLEFQLRDPEPVQTLAEPINPRGRFRGAIFWLRLRDF